MNLGSPGYFPTLFLLIASTCLIPACSASPQAPRVLSKGELLELKERRAGGYLGIGISFKQELLISKALRVESVEKDSTAEAAGLQKGDLILKIDGKSFQNWTWKQVKEELFAGPAASSMELLIRREQKELLLKVRRDLDEMIGVKLAFAENKRAFAISYVLENSPAKFAGLEEGDLIVAADEVPASGLSASDLRTIITSGEENSPLKLRVLRKQQELEFLLTRQILEGADASCLFEYRSSSSGVWGGARISNLDWDGFLRRFDSSYDDYLKHSLLLDLRGSSGNNPELAARLLARFFDSDCLLFQLKDRHETVSYERRGNLLLNRSAGGNLKSIETIPFSIKGKVIVLVDEKTAGTAEIIAACLQENKRAKVLGFASAGQTQLAYLKGDCLLPGPRLLSSNGKELKRVFPDRRAWTKDGLKEMAVAEFESGPSHFIEKVFLFSLFAVGCLTFILLARRRVRPVLPRNEERKEDA